MNQKPQWIAASISNLPIIPVSTMTIWCWEKMGHLPRHITIGRTSFWKLAEVLDFIGRSK